MRLIPLLIATAVVLMSPTESQSWEISEMPSYHRYINGNSISEIVPVDGIVWCVTNDCLVEWTMPDYTYRQVYDNQLIYYQFVSVAQDGTVWGVAQDLENSIKEVLFSYRDDSFTIYSLPEELVVTGTYANELGNLWLGTESSGVWRFDGENWESWQSDDWFAESPASILTDNTGVTWFVTLHDGVYSHDGDSWEHYTVDDGLPTNWLRGGLFDKSGRLFVWSSQGIGLFEDGSWKTLSDDTGLPESNITTLGIGSDGTIWAGIYKHGVIVNDGSGWRQYSGEETLISDKVSDIAVGTDGTVWMTHKDIYRGITIYRDGSFEWLATYSSGLPSNDVYAVEVDANGIVWFAADIGLISYDGENWTVYGNEVLSGSRIVDIFATPDGSVWITYFSSESAGVSRFDGSSWKTYNEEDGLPGGNAVSVSGADDGSIWFGLSEGAARLYNGSWEYLPGDDYLSSDEIRSITGDGDGTIWCATNNGLASHNSAGWRMFAKEDGLVNNILNDLAVAPDGSLWMVSKNTLISYDGVAFEEHPIDIEGEISSKFTVLVVGPDGTVYTNYAAATDEMRYFCSFKDGTWDVYGGIVKAAGINTVSVDSDGYPLLGSSSKGLYRLGPDGIEYHPADTSVSGTIVVLNDGRVVSLISDGSLHLYNTIDDKWEMVFSPLVNYQFRGLLVDLDGCIWRTTQDGLVYRFNGSEWESIEMDIPDSEAIPESILCQDQNGVMWFSER